MDTKIEDNSFEKILLQLKEKDFSYVQAFFY